MSCYIEGCQPSAIRYRELSEIPRSFVKFIKSVKCAKVQEGPPNFLTSQL